MISGGRSGVKELNATIKELATELNVFKDQIEKTPQQLKKIASPNEYVDPLNEGAIFG